MNTLFVLLTVQILMGLVDNLWHHEITERLPGKRSARGELALHGAREFLYGAIFLAIAWWQWHGIWAWIVATLFMIEIGITLADFIIEDKTRRLPALERVLHTLLAINVGAILVVLIPIVIEWSRSSTMIVKIDYGLWSWWFTAAAIGVTLWSLRNLAAAVSHARPPLWQRSPVAAGQSPKPRTVLVTGGTGFIGTNLCRTLIARGDRVIVLTRDRDRAYERFGPQVRIVEDLDDIEDHEQLDAIVNLAGASIVGFLWTRARKAVLLNSRVETTRRVVALVNRLSRKPSVLISASAVGYYGVRGEKELDETSGGAEEFQSELCRRWEDAATEAAFMGTRVSLLRIGLVLGGDGGTLPQLLRPLRFGLGAVLGDGRQWMSWIHREDLIRLILHVLDTEDISGPINATAPRPVRHREFMQAAAAALNRPLWFRIPAWIPRLLLGELSRLLVSGQKVLPTRIESKGFEFLYGELGAALKNLLTSPDSAKSSGDIEAFYNGACPVCSAEIAHYRRLAAGYGESMKFTDVCLNPAALEAYGLTLDNVKRRLYVRDGRGRITSGVDAFHAIWSTFPRYRRLAGILRLPIINTGAMLLYECVMAPTLVKWQAWREKHSNDKPAAQN